MAVSRLLIDTKAQESEAGLNRYLPETETSGGALATGGSIDIDSVSVHTISKGYVDIDFDSFGYTFPLTIEGWAFEFDGSVRFDLNSGSSFSSANQMRDNFIQNMGGQGVALSGFDIKQLDTTIARIETDTNRSTDNGKVAKLFVKIADTQPRAQIGALTTASAPASGIFEIEITSEGVTETAAIAYEYTNTVSESDVLLFIAETLSDVALTQSGVTATAGALELPDGFIFDYNGLPQSLETSIFLERDPNATNPTALDFSVNVVNWGTLADTALGYSEAKDFEGAVANGNELNTENIGFSFGVNQIVDLVQADGDFVGGEDKLAITKKIQDVINTNTDFTPDGAQLVFDEQTVNVLTAGSSNDEVTLSFDGQSFVLNGTNTDPILTATAVANAINNNFTNIEAVASEVTGSFILTAVGDITDPTFNISGTESEYSVSPPTVTTSFELLLRGLRFNTTTQVSTYNDQAPSISVTGDGSVATSNPVAMSDGSAGVISATSILASVKKSRKLYISSDKIYAKGFGGFYLMKEFPAGAIPEVQSTYLSMEGNTTTIGAGVGIGFRLFLDSIAQDAPLYVVYSRVLTSLSGKKTVSNNPADHLLFKVEKSATNVINVTLDSFGSPVKSDTTGWNIEGSVVADDELIVDTDGFASPDGRALVFTYPERGSSVCAMSLNSVTSGELGGNVSQKIIEGAPATKIGAFFDNKEIIMGVITNPDADAVLSKIVQEGE